MVTRRARKGDEESLASLAALLWGSHAREEMLREFSRLIVHEEAGVFLGYQGEEPIGFAQCQLRHDYVEGTQSSPVGYLEGIFVKEEFRRRGFGGELLRECEKWALGKGCTEFASDCELENDDSFHFHMAEGFAEANRVVCFCKQLQ